MKSNIINTGLAAGVTFVALVAFVLPFASAQAADYSSSPSYASSVDYSYSGSSGSYAGSVDYSYPSSGNSSPSYAESIDYTYPSYDSSPSYAESIDYTYPASGCTTNCGGGGGGCTSNCGGGGGCTYNCGGGCSGSCHTTPAPTCTISLSPSHIDYGDTVNISWSTSNAISAYLTGFGTVPTNGSRESDAIYGSKTFTLTATASNGKSVTCSKTITVKRQADLQCDLWVSDSHIERGDKVKLSWSSEGADYGRINPEVGNVDTDGSEYVYPDEDTTYKGTFYNDEGDKVTCTAKVNVDEPIVYQNPPPYINLSAVPYTGLDLGPVGTALYWGFLVLWCLIAAYLIAVKRVHLSVLRWYKKALFGSTELTTGGEGVAAPAFAGFSHADIARLAEMLRGAVAGPSHTAHTPAAQHTDAVDPFILSQIHRNKRS